MYVAIKHYTRPWEQFFEFLLCEGLLAIMLLKAMFTDRIHERFRNPTLPMIGAHLRFGKGGNRTKTNKFSHVWFQCCTLLDFVEFGHAGDLSDLNVLKHIFWCVHDNVVIALQFSITCSNRSSGLYLPNFTSIVAWETFHDSSKERNQWHQLPHFANKINAGLNLSSE